MFHLLDRGGQQASGGMASELGKAEESPRSFRMASLDEFGEGTAGSRLREVAQRERRICERPQPGCVLFLHASPSCVAWPRAGDDPVERRCGVAGATRQLHEDPTTARTGPRSHLDRHSRRTRLEFVIVEGPRHDPVAAAKPFTLSLDVGVRPPAPEQSTGAAPRSSTRSIEMVLLPSPPPDPGYVLFA